MTDLVEPDAQSATDWAVERGKALSEGKALLERVTHAGSRDVRAEMERLRTLADSYARDDEIVDEYAMALIEVARNQSTPDALAAVAANRALAAQWGDNWRINSSFAVTLVVAVYRAHDFNAGPLVGELAGLAERFGHDEFFDLRLASAAHKAVSRQQVDFGWALTQLRACATAHPGNETIVQHYADTIVERSNTDAQAAHLLAGELEAFLARAPYVEAARVGLAMVLYNQIHHGIVTQPLPWQRLAALSQQYPQDDELLRWYARGLTVSEGPMDLAGRQWVLAVVQGMAATHPDDVTIGAAYASALFNLCLLQDGPARLATAQQMRAVAQRFPDSDKIAASLAKVLYNVGESLGGPDRAAILAEMAALAARHPDTDKFRAALASAAPRRSGLFSRGR